MTRSVLEPVKRPLAIGIGSGVCSVAVTLLWLKFPSVVPVAVLVVVGVATAAASLVSGAVVVMRVAKALAIRGPLAEDVRRLPHRAWLILGALLILCNAGLAYFSRFRAAAGYFLALSIAVVAAWAAGQIVGRKCLRRDGGQGSP